MSKQKRPFRGFPGEWITLERKIIKIEDLDNEHLDNVIILLNKTIKKLAEVPLDNWRHKKWAGDADKLQEILEEKEVRLLLGK